MFVSSYDTNTGDWSHNTLNTTKPIGPEAALDWLCADNNDNRDGDVGGPLGPLGYSGDNQCFVLRAGWSGGRQWFLVVAIFSQERLPDKELERLLEASGVKDDTDWPEDEEDSE